MASAQAYLDKGPYRKQGHKMYPEPGAFVLPRAHHSCDRHQASSVCPIALQDAKKALEQAGELINPLAIIGQAKLKRYKLPTFQVLRHWFCAQAILQGVSLKIVGEWLGCRGGGLLVSKAYSTSATKRVGK